MRQRGEHSGTVSGVGFTPAGTTVVHVSQDAIRVVNDLPTSDTFDVRNKSNAAIVAFIARIVQARCFRRAEWGPKWSWIQVTADVFHGIGPF